jgi:hypothetical protein
MEVVFISYGIISSVYGITRISLREEGRYEKCHVENISHGETGVRRRLRCPDHHGRGRGCLARLWQEKRGEVEPQDLSGNLVVQLGAVTEELNRRW